MDNKIKELCSLILSKSEASKIILYSKKQNQDGSVRELDFCVAVKGDPKEAERQLYRALDADFTVNFLVYNENDFSVLCADKTSYAHSILMKGTVLHG